MGIKNLIKYVIINILFILKMDRNKKLLKKIYFDEVNLFISIIFH